MALQGFISRSLPVVSAVWLNAVDILKYTIFADSTTKAAARTALTSDAPLEAANGGTGNRLGEINASNLSSGTVPDARLNPNPPFTTIELGHASDTTLARSAAGVVTVEGKRVILDTVEFESGSYLGTLTGGTTAPTDTIRYRRVGDMVILAIPSFTAVTSNLTTMTITGALPTSCKPTHAIVCAFPPYMITDNGVSQNGNVGLRIAANSSTLSFYLGGSLTGFTASGVKAVGGMTAADIMVAYHVG